MTTVARITDVGNRITPVPLLDVNYERRYSGRMAAAPHGPEAKEFDIDEILARVKMVVAWMDGRKRAADPMATRFTEVEWCLAAGVSRSYIAAIRRRGPSGTGEVGSVSTERFTRLANTAGVDVGWLLGSGPREPMRYSSGLLTLPLPPGPGGVALVPPPTPTVTESVTPTPTNFDKAFEEIDWPADITATQAVEIRQRASEEADAAPSAKSLPLKFWQARLSQIVIDVASGNGGGSRVRTKKTVSKE